MKKISGIVGAALASTAIVAVTAMPAQADPGGGHGHVTISKQDTGWGP
jgi:hypothetical protein